MHLFRASKERLLYWQETRKAFPDWFIAHPVLSEAWRSFCAFHFAVHLYKDEATDLRYCIPVRLYGDGAESHSS